MFFDNNKQEKSPALCCCSLKVIFADPPMAVAKTALESMYQIRQVLNFDLYSDVSRHDNAMILSLKMKWDLLVRHFLALFIH